MSSPQLPGVPDPKISSKARWSNESIDYMSILDKSHCGKIDEKTIIGDFETVYNESIKDATYHQWASDEYDIKLLHEKNNTEVNMAKLESLQKNAAAAKSEAGKLLADPKAPGEGHDELRHLLSLTDNVRDSLLTKSKWTLYMAQQVLLPTMVGVIIGVDMNLGSLNPNRNATSGGAGTSDSLISFQTALIAGALLFIHAVNQQLMDINLRYRGTYMPLPFLTDAEYEAIAVGIAWIRRMVRQLLARGARNPPVAAEIALGTLASLARPPESAPEGVDTLADQGQLDAVAADQAGPSGTDMNC